MLRLLDTVTHDGRPVTGERSQALLAALARAPGRAVAETALVEAVWGPDDRPAHPGKALQVVVSRTRAQVGTSTVARVEQGYRLDLAGPDLDVSRLAEQVRAAERAESEGAPEGARDRAREALAIPVTAAASGLPGLDALRHGAREAQGRAAAVLGRTLSALGDHAEARDLLVAVADPDEATMAALLHSEAVVRGVPAALDRYARHREDLSDRLGVDPGPVLQAVHAGLLAADAPVRTGLRHETTPLVGRDDDVRRLRATVRRSRVTSILGPGGLGKTRLAHLLGHEADQPVVHFVELAGVVSSDDVVGEVGSALGVRDSVSGRRVLTAEQRADVRGRIAQQLDLVPTLLVLDNCEQVVEAVAGLVAALVATTRDLRVVTTTRAPLQIAAETVFALGRLDDTSAAQLFEQRAEAARPGVRLDRDVVRRVVTRLDGLPLAVELAAAKVRAMSVVDIDRRLDDRFALLRGSDRGAPDRHRTLLAVIDWSWNLLGETDRRALRRLAVFPDGFTLEAAETVLGHDALASLESLAAQSLLSVRDDGDRVRYRMLETVREFGRQELVAAGEERAGEAALRAWATDLSARSLEGLHGQHQVDVVAELAAEENNLADVLRSALDHDDASTAVVVLAALGGCWTIRGEHTRVMAVAGAADAVLAGWEPPEPLVDATARAAGELVRNTTLAELARPGHARALLDRYGERSGDAGTRALRRVLAALGGDPSAPTGPWGGRSPDLAVLLALGEDPDRHVAALALQWASHGTENAGDPEQAATLARRALDLWRAEDGPWTRAWHHTQLAGLYAQLGRTDEAAPHARAALGVLDDLGADDDALQLRAVLAYAAIVDGRLDDARRSLAEMESRRATGLLGGAIAAGTTRAELALAEGDVSRGLVLYDRSVADAGALRLPGLTTDPGLEPWTLVAQATAVAAHARHGRPGQPADGVALHRSLRGKALRMLDPDRARQDFPVLGCVLFALGAWALLRGDGVEEALALLPLADRFAYSRWSPSTAWAPVAAAADRVAPGELSRRVAAYGGRRGADVLDDARAAVAHILRE